MGYSFGPRLGINLKPVGNCFWYSKGYIVAMKKNDYFIECHFNVPRLLKVSWDQAYGNVSEGSSDMI